MFARIFSRLTRQPFFLSLSRDEWQGVGKKDPLTYWEAEEYPKAWGHGHKANPLPIDSVPREQLPMRDDMWFSSATKVRQVHQPQRLIPHSGLTTETRESLSHSIRIQCLYFEIFSYQANNSAHQVMLTLKIRKFVRLIHLSFNRIRVQLRFTQHQTCIEQMP